MPDTLKVYGPPGTGKTTTGVAWVVDQVRQGHDPEGVAYVSFTKAAAGEAKGRVLEQLNRAGLDLYDLDLPYCGTIHALALRALRIEGRNWLAESKLKEFAESYDYALRRSIRVDSEDEDEVAKAGGEDAILLAVWDFARHRLINDPDAAYQAYTEYDPETAFRIPYDRFVQFVHDYEAWKQMSFRRDYTDLLREAVKKRASLPVSVVAVDEAQDQTPLLWAAADTLFRDAELRACLGDSDQSIYSFQGCQPELLYGREAEETIELDHSHRLPRAVWELARRVIRQNEGRTDVEYGPCGKEDIVQRKGRPAGPATAEELEGETRRISSLADVNLRDGSTWMLLVRNWSFVSQIAEELEQAGIPYRVSGENYYCPWSEKGPLKAARAVHALSSPGGQIGMGTLREVLDKTRTQTNSVPGAWVYGRKGALLDLTEQEPGRVVSLLDLPSLGLTSWGFDRIALRDLSVLGGMSQRDRDAYANAQKAGTWGENPRVLVSTIHGVKGGEADRVVVLESCSAAPLRNLERPDRREEEIRLAYVAITRARTGFYVLEHQGGAGYPYDVFGI